MKKYGISNVCQHTETMDPQGYSSKRQVKGCRDEESSSLWHPFDDPGGSATNCVLLWLVLALQFSVCIFWQWPGQAVKGKIRFHIGLPIFVSSLEKEEERN